MQAIRFGGSFIIEKKALSPEKVQKLSQEFPAKDKRVLLDDAEHLLLMTKTDDAKIATFLRKHEITHTWEAPVKRWLA